MTAWTRREFLARTGGGLALVGLADSFTDAYASSLGEVVTKRTITGKVLQLGPQTFNTIVGQSPIHVPRDYAAWKADPKHYADWLDIDLRPIPDEDGGGVAVTRAWYHATARRHAVAFAFETLDGEAVTMRLASIGGQAPRVGRVSVLRNGFRYHNIAPETDVDVLFERTKVRWQLRLKGPTAPTSWAWEADGAESLVNWGHEGWDNADNADPVRQLDVWLLNRQRRTRLTISEPIPIDRGVRVEGSWSGELIEREAVTRRKMLSRAVVWPVIIDPTVTSPVAADADDGEEDVHAATWASTTHAYGGRIRGGGTDYKFFTGLRFINIAVDNGSTQSSSSIDVSLNKAGTAGVSCTLRADKVTDAAAWSSSSRPSQVSTTTATKTVDFTVANGPVNVECLTIAQELFGQGGWASGNDIRFVFDTTSTDATPIAHIDDLSTGSAVEAVFNCVWTAGGGPPACRPGSRLMLGVGC